MRLRSPLALSLLLLAGLGNPPTVVAMVQTTDTSPAPDTVVSAEEGVAPAEKREVIAEGSAAIGPGGLIAARRAATAQALRAAVEKTTGVYVSARTLTRNYQLVRDQVVTHAAGFATVGQVLRETDGAGEVRILLRAVVSLRPLARELKGLGLTRAWRVRVVDASASDGARDTVTTEIEKALTESGLVVVSADDQADISVRVERRFNHLDPAGADARGPAAIRGDVRVRATVAQTGEVVAALTASGTAADTNANVARGDAADRAADRLAPRLVDALLLLPAREARPVQLVVSAIGSAARAVRLGEALNALPGVSTVARHSYSGGEGVWELEVAADEQPSLARDLEESAGTKPFHLTVESDTLAKITARGDVGTPSGRAGPLTDDAAVASARGRYAPARHRAILGGRVNPVDGAEMVWIPAGPFPMGDNDAAIRDRNTHRPNNPRHTVFVGGFYMYRNLVTVAMYRRFCEATGHRMPGSPDGGLRDDHPVVNVSWQDASAYCDWAGVRLPRETEWEKAARGTDGRAYPWGSRFEEGRLRSSRPDTGDARGTAPVGAFPGGASPYGVLDMAGNAWQWCADIYDSSPLTGETPRASPRADRVIRGGSWFDKNPDRFRSAARAPNDPDNHHDNVGFRAVRSRE